MSAVGWALLEALHLYRRRSEPRHVDRGPMRFYHLLGWGLPAFITGEAPPTAPNPAPWSIPPQASASSWGVTGGDTAVPRSGLRTAAVVLAMPSLAWLLALLSVNSDALLCHYLFAASNCLQVTPPCPRVPHIPGPPIASILPVPPMVPHVPQSPHIPSAPIALIPPVPPTSPPTSPTQVPWCRCPPHRDDSGLAGSPGPRVLPDPGGLFLDAQDQPEEHDSDSDSDLSLGDEPSGSSGSTRSSDSEDEGPPPGWDSLGPPGPGTVGGGSGGTGGGSAWPGCGAPSGDGGALTLETLRVEPGGGSEGALRGDPPHLNGQALPRDPPLLPLPHPHKGILKKKGLPPISERGSTQRLGVPPPPPAGTAASSGSEGGSRVGGAPAAPRPRQSLQEQLSGVTPIAMSIKAGTADEDSSGSE
ncbi:CELR2 protein, partial [Syrrhaptes paradoxus]|nr:CELR2 protein [Syrrhaptes paradoxus]